ncbi:MAG: helicase-related protein, partial [Myxococcota bacterium]
PKVEMVEVDMDAAQDAKYDRYVREIEAALKSDDPSDKAKILGLLARMALVAIHSQLDQGYGWKNADQVSDPNAPKFEALAERVLANRTCGHIVFVDNIAAHRWVKMTLVNAGIAADRIGVLNAEVAPNAADRQRIAKEFNGDADEGMAPKFDVVIANQIAYEGIDLQTRTCAIHHLDLPWEPATLQQRNGRGVRQGNTLSAIAIYYYFARRSQDGLRFNLIQGKRGWMTQLLKSQDRDTNNPGAQMDMGPEEILLLISRNPEQTRARLEAVRAQREGEAKKKIAAEASKLLRAINARFRNAERTRDGVEAARLRGEAEERLKHLARVNVEAWPWAEHAIVVRDRPVLVAEGGGPVYEGLRVGIPSAWNASRVDYIEFGKVTKDGQIALRAAGEASWKLAKADDAKFTSLKPENYGATFPADEEAATLRAVAAVANDRLRYSGDWPGLGWHKGLDAWIERTWPQVGDAVIGALAKVSYYNAQSQKIPVVAPSGLRIVNAGAAAGTAGVTVLPPTDAGWQAFLAQAPGSGLKFGEIAEAGRWWWGRTIPRNLLSAEDDEEAAELAAGAA